jgi:WD40 repeat protein
VFTVFKSSKNEYLCVWGTQTFQISGYDFVKDKLVFTYQNAHSSTIFTTRHYFDKKEKQDLILTSSHDKSVKTWLLANGNISPILTISNAQNGCYIYSSCILFTENSDSSVIITSAPNEFQKVWSFKGQHIKDFGVNTESTYFVDSFYDGKTKKSFILNANSVDVKAYSFPDYQLFKSFKGTPNSWHMSVKMIDRNNVLTLVESDGNGTIRLWDFYEGVEILKVNTTGLNLRGICVWNVNSIFASSSDYHVKLYNIKEMKMSKTFHEHKSTVCALNKICVPKIGECLVSHGLDGKLKLWVCDKVKKVV